MSAKANIRLIYILSMIGLSCTGLFVSTLTVYLNSLGLNQTLIGVSQVVFTVSVLLSDIPMGYLADKYDRRTLNVAGNLVLAIGFGIYAVAQGVWWIMIGEVFVGLAVGMKTGLDRALLKFYSDEIDPSGELFIKNNAKLVTYGLVGMLLMVCIGMWLSQFGLRIGFALTAGCCVITAIVSCFVKDIGAKIGGARGNLLDVFRSARSVLKDVQLRWYVFTYAVAREITHAIVWVFTPLLILAGVPLYLVGIGWIFNYICSVLGALLARRILHYKLSVRFLIPMVIFTTGMIILIVWPNIFTVWLLAVAGLTHAFCDITILPEVQSKAEDKYQTIVVSISSTAGRLLYIPVVLVTNWAGRNEPVLTLVVNMIIFLPLIILAFVKLRKYD